MGGSQAGNPDALRVSVWTSTVFPQEPLTPAEVWGE